MKRLRSNVSRSTGQKLKFYHCGEYGAEENTQRPHYHAVVFGYCPVDLQLFKMSNDIPVYSSRELDAIWGLGYTTVGEVTWESCAYVARYTMKKINGPLAEKHDPETGLRPYDRIHAYTGEIVQVLPEYSTQSNGLGKGFLERYQSDIYPQDKVIVNGHPQRPPRYYDLKYEQSEPEIMESIRAERQKTFEAFAGDNTRRRLAQREQVKEAQIKKLQRKI